MAILKVSGLEGFLRKRNPAIGAILIYGEDQGAVRGLASRAVQHIAGSLEDPFAVAILDGDALSADPGRLSDEVLSLPFSGGARVVWVRGSGQGFLKAIEPVLGGSVKGNMVIAEAGSLPKQSSLRGKFESSDHALIIPVFEADNAAMTETIKAELHRLGLQISEDAKARLIELAGRGGVTLQREIEKLALYCQGVQQVTLEDVEAICGDGLWAETGDLADAVFAGNIADADRFFTQLVSSGVDPGRILSAAHGHAVRLIELRQSVERGMGVEQAVRSARPPVFFKRQATMQNQLAAWTSEDLLAAAASLHGAICQERLNAGLAESLANRSLLAVARMSRSFRVRMN
ncbi:MAG: DNA polymerase III subunit delta [Rhizobiales bacterium]|nr:DNA polymerase III subunit delta [Hyphomicrobiales bacterium]